MDSVATRPALLSYVRVKNQFCNNNKAKDSLTIFLYTRGFASRNEKDEDEGEEETRPDGYPSRVRVGRDSNKKGKTMQYHAKNAQKRKKKK